MIVAYPALWFIKFDIASRLADLSVRSESMSAHCYWCILLDKLIAAKVHGSVPQQLSLMNATILVLTLKIIQNRTDFDIKNCLK